MRYEEEITQFIENETTLTLGTTLQFGRFTTESPSRCTAVLFNKVSIAYFDVPDRIDVMVEADARDESYINARDDIEEVYNALFRRIDKALPVITSGNEFKIQTSESITAPTWVGKDENNRHHWSTVLILRLKRVE
ncbi:MAG TPA: minor capsid protein [Bacteroidales bacterium]|nr:minor capsid protein [Bacteroidales bacterium]